MFAEKARVEGTPEEAIIVFAGFIFPAAARLPERITFHKTLVLTGSVFEGDAWFDGATFGDATFRSTIFLGRTEMGARFNGLAIFEGTVFQRDTIEPDDFAYLTGPPPLPHIIVTKFDGARVGPEGEVRFIKQTNVLRGDIAINRCIDRVSLLNADLQRFNFQDVEWGTYLGRKSIIEEVLMGEEGPFRDVTPQQVRQTYANVRRNQERALRYAEAGSFFVGEMEMRTLELKGGRKLVPPLQKLPEWLLLTIYRHLAMYGESIILPFYWSIIAIISFGLARIFLASAYSAAGVGDAFMQSLMAFFQMRSEPGMDVIQRLVSIPILGSLFIAMSRKFKRR